MESVYKDMARTRLPSWITPAPRDWGTVRRGKLSADNWRIICCIHLPITLIRLFGASDGRPRELLDNFMDLVTEVVVGSLLEMSEGAVQAYEQAAMRYLRTAKELYDISVTPNQHNSLHIPLFLRLFGPLHSIRTFFSERSNYRLQSTNTNMKFGQSYLPQQMWTFTVSSMIL